MDGQLAPHFGVGIGDVIERRLRAAHDERQTVMLCIEDDTFQRQLFQQGMKPWLAILAQKMDKRCVQRVLQGLVGVHRAPILAAVVLRRETRKTHRDVRQDHFGQQGALVKHGGKKERFQNATRRALCLHHVDHGGIGGVFVVPNVGDDFVVQVIHNIHGGVVDVVHHVGLVVAVRDVHYGLLQAVIEVGGDLFAVMLLVLIAQVMVGQHGHVERLVGDILHHGQLGIFL